MVRIINHYGSDCVRAIDSLVPSLNGRFSHRHSGQTTPNIISVRFLYNIVHTNIRFYMKVVFSMILTTRRRCFDRTVRYRCVTDIPASRAVGSYGAHTTTVRKPPREIRYNILFNLFLFSFRSPTETPFVSYSSAHIT